MRRVLVGTLYALSGAAALLLALAFAILSEAHQEIREIAPPLPERAALLALARTPGGPVRVRVVNSATQTGRGRPIVHPSVALEWPDGRLFLIDAGMDREGALEFGRPMERAFGSDPIQPHGSVAEQLGSAVSRVGGIAFTHLHWDHTGGIAALCGALGRELPVFQTPLQSERGNYTTEPGRKQLAAAGCVRGETLAAESAPLYPIPGFPGLAAVAGGGHTPGSTLYVAAVRGERGPHIWIFAGDVSNNFEDLRLNRPKPLLYRLLITPEAPERLEELRRWLGALHADPRFTVVVAHDGTALGTSGIPAWRAESGRNARR